MDWLTMLETLCKLNEKDLYKALAEILQKRYDNVICRPSYMFAEGNIPVTLVAHLDTVFQRKPAEFYFDERRQVMWCPTGAGFDDRAGVCSILKILKDEYRPNIIFTLGEEVGGVGATELSHDFPICPFKTNMLIQLDRQGVGESVFYQCDNEKFEDYINSFGFETDYGSFSDISVLAPAWGIAAVNLSVGYIDEHTSSERLHLPWMTATIDKVEKILDDNKNKKRKFKYVPLRYSGGRLSWADFWNDCVVQTGRVKEV